jgi:predicted glycosyltransferase
MNNELLQKNIFYQKSKEKYNPDIIIKKSNIESERTKNIFKKNNITYNSITNQTPDVINTSKDLELKKDTAIMNIDQIVILKQQERIEQQTLIKPNKQKIIMVEEQKQSNNELKNVHQDFIRKQTNENIINKNKYEDIVKDLKDLGIFN